MLKGNTGRTCVWPICLVELCIEAVRLSTLHRAASITGLANERCSRECFGCAQGLPGALRKSQTTTVADWNRARNGTARQNHYKDPEGHSIVFKNVLCIPARLSEASFRACFAQGWPRLLRVTHTHAYKSKPRGQCLYGAP